MIPEGDKDWDRVVARRVQAVSRGRVTGSIMMIKEQRSSTFTVQTRPNNTRPQTRNRPGQNVYVELSFDPGSFPLVAGVGRVTDQVGGQIQLFALPSMVHPYFKCLHGVVPPM